MMSRIKSFLELVEVITHFYNLIGLLGIAFLPVYFTSSNTLRTTIALGGIIGGVLGYYFTAPAWKGKGKKACLQKRDKYFKLLWIPFFIFIVILVFVNPAIAEKYGFMEDIREILIQAEELMIIIIGIAIITTSYFLIGAITLNSKKLWK